MPQSRLSKPGIIEVALPIQEMRDFRESLIVSRFDKAFGVPNHQTAVQAIDGLKRKFFLIDTREDLDLLEKTKFVERFVLIHKNRLANFLKTCSNCGEKQFDTNRIVLCYACGKRFKSPGHS